MIAHTSQGYTELLSWCHQSESHRGDQGLTSAPQRWHDSWLGPTFLAATRLENPGSRSQAIVNKCKRGSLSNDWSCLTSSTGLSLCCSPTPVNGPWILTLCWFLSTRERDPLGVSMGSIRLMCPALTPIFTWLLFPPGPTAWTSRPHLVLPTLASQPTLTSTTVGPYGDLQSFYNWPREGPVYFFYLQFIPGVLHVHNSFKRRTDVTQVPEQSLWLPPPPSDTMSFPPQPQTEQCNNLLKYHTVSNQHAVRYQIDHNQIRITV